MTPLPQQNWFASEMTSLVNWVGLETWFFLTFLVVALAMWFFPKYQARRSPGLTMENYFERENEARKTLAQVGGGLLLVVSLAASTHTLRLQSETLSATKDGQITDRFTKAIEQLGSLDSKGEPNIEVRIGAIYALERIARDSERDHWPVMEVLSAYLERNHQESLGQLKLDVGRSLDVVQHLRLDLAAAMTVLGRRTRSFETDDEKLTVQLPVLEYQSINDCDFHGDAFLYADFTHSALWNINFNDGHVDSSNFSGVRLSAVSFRRTHFGDAILSGADLSGTHIEGADLRQTIGLTQDQVDAAIGDKHTLLPPGIKVPAKWLNDHHAPEIGS